MNSSPPATLQITNPETDDQPNFPVLSCANGICNNFLLWQDPQTGRLTLLPVQITVLQPITGSEPVKLSEDSVRTEIICVTPRDSSVSPESPVADIRVQPNAAPRCMNPSSCSSLEHVMELLTEEFALDGVKDLAMGKTLNHQF